ncbi:MAG: pseudouridine synthase [candidate division Zixibacteria bacterium]|nr:pseudouridine synthase [candidate division Zixibacteria bacterium]
MTKGKISRSEKPSFITLPKRGSKVRTILDFLEHHFPHINRDIWSERIDHGLVSDSSGNSISQDTAYKAGMRLSYFREVPEEIKVPFKEEILFQNNHLVAICKPHFLPVQPSGPYVRECLLNRLIKSLGNSNLVPLHRIDRETAGVVLFSGNPESRNVYHQMYKSGNIKKIYEAIGTKPSNDKEEEWLIANRIEESEDWPLMKNSNGPINARTLIKKIDEKDDLIKFRIEPLTGKGHQIRLHLQVIGSYIINDRYHPKLQSERPGDFKNPLQLIARELEFVDPISGKQFRFRSSRKLLF